MVLLTAGSVLIGYGFSAIDFSFGNDRWSRDGDRTSTFPLLGKLTTDRAFMAGTSSLLSGLLLIIGAVYIAVINYSTVRRLPLIAAGALAIGWGIWGITFSYNTADYRITHGLDIVDVPCPNAGGKVNCSFSTEDWFVINAVAIAIGMTVMVLGVQGSRFVKKTTY